MEFIDAIKEVLIYEGRFSPEFSENLAQKIMSDSERLGLETPTFNLLWTTINRETLYKKEFSQDLAEYILELYYRGGYINKAEKEIDRILQVLKPKK